MKGRCRPLLLESLAQASLGKTCLSLTSRAVSSKRQKRHSYQDSSPLGSPRTRSVMRATTARNVRDLEAQEAKEGRHKEASSEKHAS